MEAFVDVVRVAVEVTPFHQCSVRAERDERGCGVAHRFNVGDRAVEQRSRFVEVRRDERRARDQHVAQRGADRNITQAIAVRRGEHRVEDDRYRRILREARGDGAHGVGRQQRADVERLDVRVAQRGELGADRRGVDRRTCGHVCCILRGHAGDDADRPQRASPRSPSA